MTLNPKLMNYRPITNFIHLIFIFLYLSFTIQDEFWYFWTLLHISPIFAQILKINFLMEYLNRLSRIILWNETWRVIHTFGAFHGISVQFALNLVHDLDEKIDMSINMIHWGPRFVMENSVGKHDRYFHENFEDWVFRFLIKNEVRNLFLSLRFFIQEFKLTNPFALYFPTMFVWLTIGIALNLIIGKIFHYRSQLPYIDALFVVPIVNYIAQLIFDSEDIHKNFWSTLIFNVIMLSAAVVELPKKVVKFLEQEKKLYINYLEWKIQKEIFILIKKELEFFDDENVIFIVTDFLDGTMYENKVLNYLVDQRKQSFSEIFKFYIFYRCFHNK